MVQTDAANTNPRYLNVIVAAVSTSGRAIATHVLLTPSSQNGLPAPSFVKCEQLFTLSKSRLQARLGQIGSAELAQVDTALRQSLDLP